MLRVALSSVVLAWVLFSGPRCKAADQADKSLAVINAGISSAEDSPFASSNYHFLPGDYVYVTFEISGFAIRSTNRDETKTISLAFEVTPQDNSGKPLAAPDSGEIKTELAPEDKNWVPKRRASFLLPSFLAAGPFRIHIVVKDVAANAETSRDIPFLVGGTQLEPSSSITVENFRFLRAPNDNAPLDVAAYSPGDTVYARFDMAGYQNGPGYRHSVSYSVHVIAPNGKPYIDDSDAANLDSSSFYPAQFIPGDLALKTSKDSLHGSYLLILTVRDLIGNQQFEFKQSFSIE
ncbi:MAG TPA: hypothetical protein VHZ55_32545 [Bryobacteraceae bacterium]|nr:hypothetical protein [Bryobacteraceae bacterium]